MLNKASQEFLLAHARKTLEAAFNKMEPEELSSIPEEVTREIPCFVTLRKRGRLRGCLGCTATDQPLYENVAYYAHAAAFQDPRFPPMQKEELAALNIEISVLGILSPLQDLDLLKLGEQGLVVRHGRQQGLLLATVATENRWSRSEFLDHTCEKAGLDPSLRDTYEVATFSQLSFSEPK